MKRNGSFLSEALSNQEKVKNTALSLLRERFLGEELQKTENQPELEILRVQGKFPKGNEVLSSLRQTSLWEERQALMAVRFTPEQVKLVTTFTDLLDKERIGEQLTEAVFAFGKERTTQLGVTDERVSKAFDGHVRDVMNRVKQGGGKGMMVLLAAVHDISKYISVEGKDSLILGMHETSSGLLTKRIMKEILGSTDMKLMIDPNRTINDWPAMADAVADFSGLAVLGHGYEEFPQKMAMHTENQLDRREGVYRLFETQLYLMNYRPSAQWLPEGSGEEDQQLVALYEGLREADMAVGMTVESMGKYHGEALISGKVPTLPHSEGYVMTFAPTVLEYFGDLPNVLGLREKMKGDIEKSLLLLAAVKRGQNPEFFQEGFEKLSKIGIDMQEIDRFVQKMRYVFPEVSLPEKERIIQFAHHYEEFLKLIEAVDEIPAGSLRAVEDSRVFDDLRRELFVETTPNWKDDR